MASASFSRCSVLRIAAQTQKAHAVSFNVKLILDTQHLQDFSRCCAYYCANKPIGQIACNTHSTWSQFQCYLSIGNIAFANFSRLNALRYTARTNKAHAINFNVSSILDTIASTNFSRFSVLRIAAQTKGAHAINFNVISILETQHLQILAFLALYVLLFKQTYWKDSICKFQLFLVFYVILHEQTEHMLSISMLYQCEKQRICKLQPFQCLTYHCTNKQSTCSQFQCYLSVGNIASANSSRFNILCITVQKPTKPTN